MLDSDFNEKINDFFSNDSAFSFVSSIKGAPYWKIEQAYWKKVSI